MVVLGAAAAVVVYNRLVQKLGVDGPFTVTITLTPQHSLPLRFPRQLSKQFLTKELCEQVKSNETRVMEKVSSASHVLAADTLCGALR